MLILLHYTAKIARFSHSHLGNVGLIDSISGAAGLFKSAITERAGPLMECPATGGQGNRPVRQSGRVSGRRVADLLEGGIGQIRWSALGWIRRCYGTAKLLASPAEMRCLRKAPPASALGALVARQENISALAAQPFVCAAWPSGLRLRRMIDHCAIIDRLGHPFTLSGDQYVEIIGFDLGDQQCRLTLDQPAWFGCDGLLTATMWVDIHRLFSISFCLSDQGAQRVAYIGGLQGRRGDDVLAQKRGLTKAAHGMRPRDLAFELFRMLLPHLGVTRLKCVTNANRSQMTMRALQSISTRHQVLLDYDELCESRGGRLGDDGFYTIPVIRLERESADIPVRKRAMYNRRYVLLRQLADNIASALRQGLPIRRHDTQEQSVWHGGRVRPEIAQPALRPSAPARAVPAPSHSASAAPVFPRHDTAPPKHQPPAP